MDLMIKEALEKHIKIISEHLEKCWEPDEFRDLSSALCEAVECLMRYMELEKSSGLNKGLDTGNRKKDTPIGKGVFTGIEMEPFYANNKVCQTDIHFTVPAEKWKDFIHSGLLDKIEGYTSKQQEVQRK